MYLALILFSIIFILKNHYYILRYFNYHPKLVSYSKNGHIDKTEKTIFKEIGLKNDSKSLCLLIPDSFTHAQKFLESKNLYYYSYVNGLDGMDFLVSKRGIYLTLKKYYSSYYTDIIPETWSTSEFNFNKKENKNDIFVVKKDIQRQEGIVLSSSPNDIKDIAKDKSFVIVQKFLKDPLLISGHKTNIRVYLLLVMHYGKLKAYVHDDGFIYYTPDKFKICLNHKNTITSGYIDRKIYEDNPLTIKDLQKHLNATFTKPKDVLKELICPIVSKLLVPYSSIFESKNCVYNISYQIFGIDVELKNDLETCKIIECNKAPDLSAKDARDLLLKERMFRDSMDIIRGKPPKTFKIIKIN
jgi:hypothetical protein